ncbi:hypothetical protein M2404_003651 [Rheinheimera pacifica]|uniref:hypothetical protein n=1 Tax=Rheinheimera pacifica TaxID=173990 RepID=UPI0021692F3E|nr:hypothetical protein [Rheinheimera pacifica]MCS4309280.1 hypothetical protein [Rheinheimera pacifica]
MTTRYITDTAAEKIVALLDEWATGQLGTGLSWAGLEKAFGYTRQALSANPLIKNKFNEAKQALKQRKRSSSTSLSEDDELQRLRHQNEELNRRVKEFERRFTRWIHNCHMKGVNPLDLDTPMGISPKTALRNRDKR